MTGEAVAVILFSLLAVGLAHDETCTTLGLLAIVILLAPAMTYTSTTLLAEETVDAIGSKLVKDYIR